jgi:hypothetical protein
VRDVDVSWRHFKEPSLAWWRIMGGIVEGSFESVHEGLCDRDVEVRWT